MYLLFKARSIQGRLFTSYSLLIAIIVIILITSFYFYTANTLKKETSPVIQKNAEYISAQLDAELKSMNTISEKIMASAPFRELFFENAVDEKAVFYNRERLNEILLSITGPVVPVYQINIFKTNGRSLGFGNFFESNSTTPADFDTASWIKDTIKNDGNKVITLPHVDDWGYSKERVISLNRSFSETYGQQVNSIIEVQQQYDRFKAIIEQAIATPKNSLEANKKIYILNPQNKLVYPFEVGSQNEQETTNQIAALYLTKMKGLPSQTNTFALNNPYTHNKEILAYFNSEFSGWTVFVAESEKQLFKPIDTFRNYTLLSGLLILLITLIFSYYVSKGLTHPIKKIYQSINRLSLDTLSPIASLDFNTNLNELEALNHSYMRMVERLKDSLETIVSSRSHEIQSRMLALQSQMNPHFLYNTLAVISITADNHNQQDIVKMCEDLSDMLRYIVSESSTPVTIADELEYTKKYLSLMQKRYLDQFHCTIDVSEHLLQKRIPKLTIQPLIENCFKHGINVPPQWKFSILGKDNPEGWTITVRDNGTGFNEQMLQTLLQKSEENFLFDSEGANQGHEIGLANIASRMRLFFNESAVFEIRNHPGGGASVTIGVNYNKGELQ